MIATLTIRDNFCDYAEAVRQSALESGFGTWKPNQGIVGSSNYEGMNFYGAHGIMLRSLSAALGGVHIFPNSMFFRVTTPETERAYIHSDRETGEWTCVAYLSEHAEDVSGTAFFRHRKTGLREMPSFEEMKDQGTLDLLGKDMVSGLDEDWEQLDFVRGCFNRAVIFHAPLFHSRMPREGIGGGSPETARMVWVAHFSIG
jgi:hypothetical protein